MRDDCFSRQQLLNCCVRGGVIHGMEAESCLCSRGYGDGHYVLPPLPYEAGALEPFLDAETVTIHHDRHHAAYVAGANAAAESIRKVAANVYDETMVSAATQRLAFNLGGHILHCLYWSSLCPEPQGAPEGALADAVNESFGGYDGFLRVFRGVAIGLQGSGWAVLGRERLSGRLAVLGIERHQDVLVPGFKPLLACDVWEHAYYLRYKNNRAGYVDAFLRQVDWAAAQERMEHRTCHGDRS